MEKELAKKAMWGPQAVDLSPLSIVGILEATWIPGAMPW